MTSKNSIPTQEQRQQLAQQLFCTKTTYLSLTKIKQRVNKPTNNLVIFNDIVQWVKGNNQADFIARVPVIIKKINTDLVLHKIYLNLVQQLRFAESGFQAAASSKLKTSERVTEYFALTFKQDQHSPSQFYVILTINHPTEAHLNHPVALHITTEIRTECLYFPPLVDGRSQLLMEQDEQAFALLSSNHTRLFLM